MEDLILYVCQNLMPLLNNSLTLKMHLQLDKNHNLVDLSLKTNLSFNNINWNRLVKMRKIRKEKVDLWIETIVL